MTTSTDTTILFKGKSGREYKFWIYPLGTSFKELPGIYGWLKETQPGTFRPLYFGQTKNLSDRHGGGHHKEDEVKRNGATHICARVTSGSEADRLAEEKDLIENYKPVCNDTFC
jgi:hypothetical protein